MSDGVLAELIVNGDAKKFRRYNVSPNSVDRIIFPLDTIVSVPRSRPDQGIAVRGPTVLIWAILCEQNGIVEIIMEEYEPDLSIRVDGKTALHFAAMIPESECLTVLLRTAYFHHNVSCQVDGVGATALHVAVSNRSLRCAMVLVTDLPDVRYGDPCDDVDGLCVNLMTTSGASSLHIAARMTDYDMCRILVSANADTTARDAAGRTPADVAKCVNTNEGIRVACFLESPVDESLLSVISSLGFRFENPVGRPDDDSETESDSETNSLKTSPRVVEALIHQMTRLEDRLSRIESSFDARICVNPPVPRLVSQTCLLCARCGSIDRVSECGSCLRRLCGKCTAIHECAT